MSSSAQHNVQHSQLCGHCKKAAITLSCPHCRGAPGYENEESVKTNYCNAACQKAHWGYHKLLCKEFQARKCLYRAGDTLQQILYLFQKSKWSVKIYDAERVKEQPYQYQDYPVEKCDTLFLYKSRHSGSGSLPPFPDALFLSDREKESALAHLSCHDSILSMHDMVMSILQGICSKIEEVTVHPKNNRFKIVFVSADNNKDLRYYRHELFRVTTSNGEMYALDLTSAQNGYYEPLVPWHAYERLRVVKISRVRSFGETQSNELLIHPPRNYDLYDQFMSSSRAYLNLALHDWQTLNVAVNVLLRLPEQEFVRKRSELYTQIGADLERGIREIYEETWDNAMEEEDNSALMPMENGNRLTG